MGERRSHTRGITFPQVLVLFIVILVLADLVARHFLKPGREARSVTPRADQLVVVVADSRGPTTTRLPPPSPGVGSAADSQDEVEATIEVPNASGRSGAYYLPGGPRAQPVPLLVALHQSSQSGGSMIYHFRRLARARHFAIIGPDSRLPPTWEVGDQPGDVTPDLLHVLACIEWVRQHTRLVVDPAHVLIAGYSGGGSSAPYVASNRPGFTHIALLHGGVFPGGIGPNRMPVWVSTGEQDSVRPVALVQQAAAALTNLGFTALTFRTYRGGHGLSPAEANDLIDWWLGDLPRPLTGEAGPTP